MYNLSNNIRRATIDIDLDLIRIYLADDNLYNIFTSYKMNGIDIIVDKGKIVNLNHQDYKGKRIPLIIRDNFGNEITAKIDVGVNTEFDIAQDEFYFDCQFSLQQTWSGNGFVCSCCNGFFYYGANVWRFYC